MLKSINDASPKRYISLNVLILIVFSVLLINFFLLQIKHHSQYKEKSNINSVRAENLYAPRGMIIDRNRKIIVDNKSTYVLTALPNNVGNIDETISSVSKLIDVDSTLLANNYTKYYKGYFQQIILKKDLTIQQISLLEEHKLDLPGIEYKQIHERNYPSEMNGAHILGYVVEVDRDKIKKIENSSNYKFGDIVGWQGLEKYYENLLSDKKGIEYRAVDAYGRNIGKIDSRQGIAPEPGEDLVISIDLELQHFIENLLSGKRGCVIISDPETGEIFSFVNFPHYPADLFTGITPFDDWNKIINDPEKPLLNRITHGLYPPGSTMKMVVLAYVLEHNVIDPSKQIFCSGKYQLGNRSFGCWKEWGHGNVDLDKALIESCDVYFYSVIQKFPLDDWAAICKQFGFASKTGIDLPSEKVGKIPDVKYYDSRFGKNKWTRGLKLNLSIGQGEIQVTPIQMLTYINLIYTHGNTFSPHFAKSSTTKRVIAENISNSTWDHLNRLLYRVVNSQYGTGKLANPNIDGLTVTGKTGTAENSHGEPHAWFIGYAYKDEIKRSFVILLENAGHGGDEAAPIVAEILDFIYRDSRELIDSIYVANIRTQ